MEWSSDWVQRHQRVLKLASTITNSVDPRNWVLTIALFFLDLALNASSIYYALPGDRPAVICMGLALCFMALQVPFIGFYFKYSLDQRNLLSKAFKSNDQDNDGRLTPSEALGMLEELPEGTIVGELSPSVKKYSIDNILWLHHQPRMFSFRFLEFSVSWLMFFASLMLIKPGDPISALVAVQNVVSILGLMLVLNDFFENYFRKYHPKDTVTKYACAFSYVLTLVAIFGVLLAGYGFASLIYAGRETWTGITVNVTWIPVEDLIGFTTGWFLTCFTIAAFLLLACANFCCARIGLVDVHVPQLGDDDPIKHLRKRGVSILKSQGRKHRKEEDGASSTSPPGSFDGLAAADQTATKMPPLPPAIRPGASFIPSIPVGLKPEESFLTQI